MVESAIVLYSIPAFFILIGVELLVARLKNEQHYRLNDAITSIACGVSSEVVGVFIKSAFFFAYILIFEHLKIYEIPNTIWSWIILFFGVDFFYYWFHRKSHEINMIWATHIVHHQSEEYNLSTALRQAWFQTAFSWVFYLPLAFVGFDPKMFIAVKGINLVYQFWIHTKMIGRMGVLEWFMNTPSHHRVHHGKNPKYLDKNYAAVFIIWDRMFGTFQKEEEEPVFGTTKTLESFNPVWTNFHYWVDLFKLAARCTTLKDKINVFLKPPGWQPEELGGFQHAPEVDKMSYKKYTVPLHQSVSVYVLIQFVLVILCSGFMLFDASSEDPLLFKNNLQKCFAAFVFVLTLLNCGGMLEQKKWLRKLELIRLLAILALPAFFYGQVNLLLMLPLIAAYVLASSVWLLLNQKHLISQDSGAVTVEN
ncbi:MAG TPA: sterol desaturase family protein [Flavobacteriales bacterium]|nr:sterol desaturase family protein [Flavobacteriales bacterium]